MKRYIEISGAIYAYFDYMLMNKGANTWDEYKAVVGKDVGPFDRELWDLFIKLNENKKTVSTAK
jgi:hypothetical protein